jgi:hypothetical protein
MRRLALVGLAVATAAAFGAGSAGADPGTAHATCEAILVSAATYPGEVADLGRLLHSQLKDAGIPPGVLDVGGAQTKAGSFDACVAALFPS